MLKGRAQSSISQKRRAAGAEGSVGSSPRTGGAPQGSRMQQGLWECRRGPGCLGGKLCGWSGKALEDRAGTEGGGRVGWVRGDEPCWEVGSNPEGSGSNLPAKRQGCVMGNGRSRSHIHGSGIPGPCRPPVSVSSALPPAAGLESPWCCPGGAGAAGTRTSAAGGLLVICD